MKQPTNYCRTACQATQLSGALVCFIGGCVYLTRDQGIDHVSDMTRFTDMAAGFGLLSAAVGLLCLSLKPTPESTEQLQEPLFVYRPPQAIKTKDSHPQTRSYSTSV